MIKVRKGKKGECEAGVLLVEQITSSRYNSSKQNVSNVGELTGMALNHSFFFLTMILSPINKIAK